MAVRVSVVWSVAPRVVDERPLELPDCATVRDALHASGAIEALGLPDGHHWTVAVWSAKARPEQVLHEGDRVELCRPLRVDPKVARRERFQRQGSRGAGLFASRRPGAKPGY